jgi:ribosomal protein L28
MGNTPSLTPHFDLPTCFSHLQEDNVGNNNISKIKHDKTWRNVCEKKAKRRWSVNVHYSLRSLNGAGKLSLSLSLSPNEHNLFIKRARMVFQWQTAIFQKVPP